MGSSHRGPYSDAGVKWLDPVSIWAEVRRKTAADVGAAEPPWDAFGALCESLNSLGPRLHLLGKQRIRRRLTEVLTWRVRLAQALAEHPEIAIAPLCRAVVIVAPFRTGTTLLQRLLAADARFRWVRPWEALYAPCVVPTRLDPNLHLEADERIECLQRDLRNLHRRHPELAHLHPMGANQPDECFGLLETSLLSPSFLFYAPVSGYMAWLEGVEEAAWDIAYAHYADHLRLLAWLYPSERWLLKNPIHLWNLGALRRAFPDAVLVHLHRDPAESMRSFCRLLAAHHEISLRATELRETGRLVGRFYEFALPRAVAARRAAPVGLDVDIAFRELIQDPMTALSAIYDAAGLDLDAKTEIRMRRWLADSEPPRPSAAHPELADFGLREIDVREMFVEYQAFGSGGETG